VVLMALITETRLEHSGRRRRARTPRSYGSLSSRRSRQGLLLVLPAVALVAIFFFLPLLFGVYISLTNWPLIGPVRFIGLSNYITLFTSTSFWQSVVFSLEFTLLVVPGSLVGGYVLAHLLRAKRRLAPVVRAACLIPTIIGITTISYMFVLELQPGIGAFGVILHGLGLGSATTAWLTNPTLALVVIAGITVWAGSGFTALLLMAGMQSIPEQLYEASRLDGARLLEREWYITIPLMRRTIALVLIITVVASMLVFSQFLILTNGGPGTSTSSMVLFLYDTAFGRFQVGYGTAISLVLFVMLLSLSGLQFWLLRERE